MPDLKNLFARFAYARCRAAMDIEKRDGFILRRDMVYFAPITTDSRHGVVAHHPLDERFMRRFSSDTGRGSRVSR